VDKEETGTWVESNAVNHRKIGKIGTGGGGKASSSKTD